MPRSLRLLFCSLLVLLPTAAWAQAGVTIAGIEARLFYSNSGRLSANVIGNPKITLHNVIIGEGGVEGPSEQTLLVVLLQGAPKSHHDGLSLRITAVTEADTLADEVIEVGTFNTSGNYYAPCWLPETGCEPIQIFVELSDGKKAIRAKSSLPFDCAE